MKYMKQILSMILCVILLGGTIAYADDFVIAPEDENLILAYYCGARVLEGSVA